MMSHMCGASNRGDARTIAEARREKAKIALRLNARNAERDHRLHQLQTEISALRKRLRELEPLAAECDRLREILASDAMAQALKDRERETELAHRENIGLKRSLGKAELRLESLRARLDVIARRRDSVNVPVEKDERLDELAMDENAIGDLCGRCLLCVGGKPQPACRLRTLVAHRNGRLLHHHGGIEQSSAQMGELVWQVDGVFFPVDCVGLGAMDWVKKLCERHGNPMIALRTTGVTTFTRSIEASKWSEATA